MSSFQDTDYKKYLLPRRLIFFDLDGTIIPSTAATGRRIAIAMSCYDTVKAFMANNFAIADTLPMDESQCSSWYKKYGGPEGLIRYLLAEVKATDEVKDCISFYYHGLFSRRLTQYDETDLQYDSVPQEHIDFLYRINEQASILLISYRYQTQFDFLSSLEKIKLTHKGLFGPHNAFAVGGPGTSADGSKSRFVGSMWRKEIRAQRRLTSAIGKRFSPIVIGDSTRDVHFAVDIGSIFFGVSATGESSHEALVQEIKKQADNLSSRSRVFPSLADEQLQKRVFEECSSYQDTVRSLA